GRRGAGAHSGRHSALRHGPDQLAGPGAGYCDRPAADPLDSAAVAGREIIGWAGVAQGDDIARGGGSGDSAAVWLVFLLVARADADLIDVHRIESRRP